LSGACERSGEGDTHAEEEGDEILVQPRGILASLSNFVVGAGASNSGPRGFLVLNNPEARLEWKFEANS